LHIAGAGVIGGIIGAAIGDGRAVICEKDGRVYRNAESIKPA